jgi:predicted DNA-binding transcriptional regulator AlpA
MPVARDYTEGSHVIAFRYCTTMQQLYSPRTLATHLGLAQQTIYNRHSGGGDLPKAIKLGHLLRFSPDDVEVWLNAKRQATAAAPSSVA